MLLDFPVWLEHGLIIGVGLCWTAAYVLIIRRGFLDKACGMPLPALCANISWEFIFVVMLPMFSPQIYCNIAWLLFDVAIVYVYLAYGRRFFPKNLSPKLFYPAFLLVLAVSFAGVLLTVYEFRDVEGTLSGGGICLMMSILFVHMLAVRDSIAGQSVYIALAKWLGTLQAVLLIFFYYPRSYLLPYIYIAIFIFDGIYFSMLHHRMRAIGMDPWKRL